MTFPNDGTCMLKMEYSEEEISAVLAESEQEQKRLRKLGKLMETAAAYRLKKLQHFQAREQLATWRRTHGYDRDDSWVHGTRPLSSQKFTANLRSDLQELKDAISMSGRARPWQKAKELLDGLEGDLLDEELADIKRYLERRSRKAAQVAVMPVSTVQHCIPRSLTPEIPPDVCVGMEEKDEEVRMNPESTELESPSAGTGLETPGSSFPRTGRHGRQDERSPTAICSLAWVQIRGETLLYPRNALVREPVQLRHRQIHQTPLFGRQAETRRQV